MGVRGHVAAGKSVYSTLEIIHKIIARVDNNCCSSIFTDKSCCSYRLLQSLDEGLKKIKHVHLYILYIITLMSCSEMANR